MFFKEDENKISLKIPKQNIKSSLLHLTLKHLVSQR